MRVLLVFFFVTAFFSRTNSQSQTKPPFSDTARLVNILNLQQDGKTMIALTFGQSNAANHGQSTYIPHNAAVYNYYNGKLYTAKDPMLGATGEKGSVWCRLGDMLIDKGLYTKVIFIPIAVGATDIDCWTNGGCFKKLQQTLNMLDSQHIKLTHIFWHQGESDNLKNTSSEKYKEQLAIILQTLRKTQSADLYICLASYHPAAIDKPLGVDVNIRHAQREFINENKTVLEGPDTDNLIYAIHRYDGVHFSDFGMKAFAQLWLNAIINKEEKVSPVRKPTRKLK